MESLESDLLVAIPTSNYYEDVDPSSNGHIYDNGDLKESLVQENKHSPILEYEGNINCAMDIFAPDYGSDSSKNLEYSTSGRQSFANFCDMEEKTMSDCEKSEPEKASSCNYVSFMSEQAHMDSISLSSDISEAGRNIFSPKNPSTPTHFIPDRVACTSPHFPTSNITFPSSANHCSPSTTQWSTFGENKENTVPPSPYKSRFFPARPPPAIPERKSLRRVSPVARSSPIQHHHSSTSSPTADLLSMDMVDLQNHLSDTASSPIPGRPLGKPVIPPRKALFSTGSTSSRSQLSDAEVDVISSSLPEGHINHAHNSSDSSPLPLPKVSRAIKGPPVPPRKNAPKIEFNIITALATTGSSVKSGSESLSLQNTESESCPSWANFMDSNTDTVNNTSCNISDTKTGTSPCGKDSATDELKSCVEEEDPHWSKRLSPDTRSAVKKKGTGGIGYLSLENDDCDTIDSIGDVGSCNLAEYGVVISLPTNDLSPEKPQSQWATFHNEEEDDDDDKNDANIDNLSCSAISLPSGGMNSTGSGFAGSFNDVDVADLEDDFVINPNRLSAEMPNLKGFNRADKGSQNNLVDFSDDRGSVAVSMGSHEDGDEDVETIFDLTAQGDSLKRKRPRGSITVVANLEEIVTDGSVGSSHMVDALLDPHANVSFHVGPAGLDDYVFADENNSFHAQTKYVDPKKTESDHPSSCSSRAETPSACPVESNCDVNQSMSNNPFWSPSMRTAPSSGSQSSSADTPFDAFVFSTSKSSICHDKSKPTTPIRINPVSTPSTPVPLIRIPPPPLSHSRSSSRQRRSSHAIDRIRHTSHDSRRRLELDSASDFSQSVSTLPSSRAETPTLAATNKDVANETEATTSPIFFADDVLEPFPTEAWQDSPMSNFVNKDLFTWLDDSQPDGCLSEQRAVADKGKSKMDHTNDTLPSDQCAAATSISSRKNCNMNANAAEPVSKSDNFIIDLNTTLYSECKEDEDLTSPTILICDTLPKLNNTLSMENLDVKAAETNSILPEIDLVQFRSSWDVFMRFPMTKRTMSNRKWVPIHIKLFNDPVDHPQVKLYYTANLVKPFHTLSLASHQMQMSKPVLQPHFSEDGQILGKLHALKLNIVQYKEKQTFTRRRSLTRNASGFKHACKGKQTIKLGFSLHHEVVSFVEAAGDAMFYAHKLSPKSNNDEHVPTVKYHSRNEILVDVVDEVQAVVDESGVLKACKVRVHFFVGSFLSGDPMAKININDQKVAGKEVVPREDIIPSSLDGWIEVCDPELHESCTSDSLKGDNAGMCICYPPDACRFELMRFKTNYTESELPLKVKSNVIVKCARLQLRCNVMLNDKLKDGFGQLVCEDIMVRFPVPDDWCVYFKVEGKFKKHSIRAKRSAKSNIKTPTMAGVSMEASIGIAKYEKAYQAIVWRIPRLPDKGAVAKPHTFSCRIELVSDRDLNKLRKLDESGKTEDRQCTPGLDDKFKFCEVEYSMIGPVASKVSVRSVSTPNTVGGERFISYSSNYLYKVGISVTVERISDDEEVDPADLCLAQ